ncbi:MAG: Cys-tRNA(Pro) deacylase [Thermodesulfobacteriota bacterium]
MTREKLPVTSAIRFLREHRVDFIERPYQYEEHGGTETAAKAFGVDEHIVVKTLVMEDEEKKPFIILMHGDREVSTKALARTIGAKSVNPCTPETALKHTGYRVGGISPFRTKKVLPVYAEESILSLPKILINAGKRGLLAEVSPSELMRVLKPVLVRVAR